MPAPTSEPSPAASVRTAVLWDVLGAALGLQPSPEVAASAWPVGATHLDVLDAGGGSGGFAVPLAAAGHRVTVVDPSPDALAALARRAAERGVSDRVVGLQGDLDDLDSLVGADSTDLVLCHSVLEVVDAPAAALAAAAAVLRTGGRLSLLVANRAAVVLARALAGHLDEAERAWGDPDGRWGSGDRLQRRFSAEQLLALVRDCGLVVQELRGVRVLSDLVPSSALDAEAGAGARLLALERALSTSPPFRDLATQLHVLARRD